MTANAISLTSFNDQSGGVRPGVTYTYHVTASYPNFGLGTADVSFTPPAAAVPIGLHAELRSGKYVVAWTPVPGATAYQVIETWTLQTSTTIRMPDGRSSTSTTTLPYTVMLTTADAWAPVQVAGAGTTTVESNANQTIARSISRVRYDVAVSYPPSGVTAPRSLWPSINVP